MGCRRIFFVLLMAAHPVSAQWEDVTATSGIDFLHTNRSQGDLRFVETAASGGGFVDFDGDGDLDIYLVTAAANSLWENQGGRFVDVSTRSGLADAGYGMGFCIGDVNQDGLADIMVTNYGSDSLYINNGDGQFENRAGPLGVADSRWSAACSFADLDSDGDLDLYVARYAVIPTTEPVCQEPVSKEKYYCQPKAYAGEKDSLYIWNGAAFEDRADQAGLDRGVDDRGFGVVLEDFDRDGDVDVYVANDGTMNRLYENDGNGRFTDQSLFSGAGLNAMGQPEAGMGAVAEDFDGDDWVDLFITHYAMESNTLYLNRKGDFFDDVTDSWGLAKPSLPWVGWGSVASDFDMDGDLDIVVANGHPLHNISVLEPGFSYPQPNHLYSREGDRFVQSPTTGPWKDLAVSRGAARGDFDNDGCDDVLITNTNDQPALLQNRCGVTDWLGVSLMGARQNRLAIGAKIQVSGRSPWRRVVSGESFLSQSDLRHVFVLKELVGSVSVAVAWPGGDIETFTVPTESRNRYVVLKYGSGVAAGQGERP